LTSLGGHAGAPRWSPDGHSVAFEFRPKQHSEIFVVDVPGGVPRLVPTFPGSNNGGPNWSRDGQYIYFYSDRGGGPFQLWRVPSKGGPPIQVTRNGGIFGTESLDRRFLYYAKFDENGIWRMPLEGGEETRVFDQAGGGRWSSWALAQNGIYFLGHFHDPARETVQFFDFTTHNITSIWTLEKAGSGSWGLALSADGRSIIYPQIEFEQSNVMLVKNFH
jgi:dipeptidyl aminopeptidase/acylaminoacyl peptidase